MDRAHTKGRDEALSRYSDDEEEVRGAVVDRLRELMPTARIVHELNVAGTSSNRIDVAAVDRQAIVAVEIKSRKDTLKRLDEQWVAFSRCCHLVIVAAHEKHFIEYRDPNWRESLPAELRLNHPGFDSWDRRKSIWRYPRPERDPRGYDQPWAFCAIRDVRRQPQASAMLDILWAEELRAECSRHRLSSGPRRNRPEMIADMVWNMTGREIAEAVCRQIRQRSFVRADPPDAPSNPPSMEGR